MFTINRLQGKKFHDHRTDPRYPSTSTKRPGNLSHLSTPTTRDSTSIQRKTKIQSKQKLLPTKSLDQVRLRETCRLPFLHNQKIRFIVRSGQRPFPPLPFLQIPSFLTAFPFIELIAARKLRNKISHSVS